MTRILRGSTVRRVGSRKGSVVEETPRKRLGAVISLGRIRKDHGVWRGNSGSRVDPPTLGESDRSDRRECGKGIVRQLIGNYYKQLTTTYLSNLRTVSGLLPTISIVQD